MLTSQQGQLHGVMGGSGVSGSGGSPGGGTNTVLSSAQQSQPTLQERYLELHKEDPTEAYGFNIKGGSDIGCPVYIWRVEPGTLADRQGMKSGDEILSANGIPFNNITHAEALKVLKSQLALSMYIRPSQPVVGCFRGEFYTWVDTFGSPTPPPKEIDLARAPTRLVDLQIDPGQNLGLMIRGGSEYGLGIYVTGVDHGSVAERGGLKRGDEILQVNNRQFTNITHDRAVSTLKSSRKMTLTLAHVGKIPADLTYEPRLNSSSIAGPNLPIASQPFSSALQTGGSSLLAGSSITNNPSSISSSSTITLQMIEEKARTVLTKSEHSRFTFYRLEYAQGFITLYTFVRILLELLNTHEKYTLLTEVREIIRPEDRSQFDELIYKPADPSTSSMNTPLHAGGASSLLDPNDPGLDDLLDPHNPTTSNDPYHHSYTNTQHPPQQPPHHTNNNSSSHQTESNGDLVYLREFTNQPPTNNPLIQSHLMDISSGNTSDLVPLINTSCPQSIMSSQISTSTNNPNNKLTHMQQQQTGTSGSGSSGSAVRFRVRCTKTKSILGIGIEGGANTLHRLPRIININPEGSAYTSNLKAGQVILSVDGKKLDGLSHEEIVRVITDCYATDSRSSIDFIVVENRNNLVVVGGSGVGIGNNSNNDNTHHSPTITSSNNLLQQAIMQ